MKRNFLMIFLLNQENKKRIIHDKLYLTCMEIMFYPRYPVRKVIIHSFTRDRFINLSINFTQITDFLIHQHFKIR